MLPRTQLSNLNESLWTFPLLKKGHSKSRFCGHSNPRLTSPEARDEKVQGKTDKRRAKAIGKTHLGRDRTCPQVGKS
jgi:hypothetical protein